MGLCGAILPGAAAASPLRDDTTKLNDLQSGRLLSLSTTTTTNARDESTTTNATSIPLELTVAVTTSASVSMACASVLAITCWLSYRAVVSESPQALGIVPLLQIVLANLGAADAIFAFSFVLAQARDEALPTGGAACQAAAVLNECAGIVSGWLTIGYGWLVRSALVHGGRTSDGRRWDSALRSRVCWRVLPAVWLLPMLYEVVIFAAVYAPRDLIGPEQSVPWCHWKEEGDGRQRHITPWSAVVYGNVVIALFFVVWAYCDALLRLHSRARTRRALLAELRSSATADEQDPQSQSRAAASSSWRLDARLTSYLGAYCIAQVPSLLHRMLQVFGQSPEWLAQAQCATQPAQGFLNALVFCHHTRKCRCTRPDLAMLRRVDSDERVAVYAEPLR